MGVSFRSIGELVEMGTSGPSAAESGRSNEKRRPVWLSNAIGIELKP